MAKLTTPTEGATSSPPEEGPFPISTLLEWFHGADKARLVAGRPEREVSR